MLTSINYENWQSYVARYWLVIGSLRHLKFMNFVVSLLSTNFDPQKKQDVTKMWNGMINRMIHGMKGSSLVDLSWLLKDRNTHVISLALQSEQTIYAPASYQCSLMILL